MYEVSSKNEVINGEMVTVWKRDVINANIISVEAGTTGYRGGDSGHGGRTVIRIEDEGSTDIEVTPIKRVRGGNGGVEIKLGGDAELATIIEGLKWITKVLEEEARDNS